MLSKTCFKFDLQFGIIMKSIYLIIAILGASNIFAQTNLPKNELGLNLYNNEFEFATILNKSTLKHYTLTGLQYKRNLNNTYLLRFLFNNKNESYSESYADWIVAGGTTLLFGIIKTQDYKIGIERIFGNRTIKPFAFIDIGYRYFNNKGVNASINSQSPASNNFDLTNHYLNYAIGFGVKYYPTNYIYLSAETCIGYHRQIFDGSLNPNYVELFNPINTFVFGVRF